MLHVGLRPIYLIPLPTMYYQYIPLPFPNLTRQSQACSFVHDFCRQVSRWGAICFIVKPGVAVKAQGRSFDSRRWHVKFRLLPTINGLRGTELPKAHVCRWSIACAFVMLTTGPMRVAQWRS